MEQQSFQSIEKHLYKRQYETSTGDWSTLFYAIFTCWDGRRRTFKAGETLADARDELGRLRSLDKGRFDFDADKKKLQEQKRRAITFSDWGNRYFADKLSPNALRPNSAEREKRSFELLQKFFGELPLANIDKSTILGYRKKRTADSVGFITINRELSFLRKLLNVAADQEPPIIETVPRFKLPNEMSRARTGTVDAEKFEAILSHMRRPAQRYLIALHETSMRLMEPTKLKWDMVDLKAGLLRLPPEIVKEKFPRRTPISWEFRQVLEELRTEQHVVPNLGSHVFTRQTVNQ